MIGQEMVYGQRRRPECAEESSSMRERTLSYQLEMAIQGIQLSRRDRVEHLAPRELAGMIAGHILRHQPSMRPNLEDLAVAIYGANRAKGFWPEDPIHRNPFELIALIHSELSEAVEELRKGRPPYYLVGGKPEGWAVELVDAMIRILDVLGAHGQAVDMILENKLAYNASRPHRHGGKLA